MENAGQAPLKIALTGDSLSGGGAEKIQAWLSRYLASSGHSVQHILFSNDISYAYSGKVSIVASTGSKLSNLKRAQKMWRLYKRERFDVVIDFRMKSSFFHERLFQRSLGETKLIYTVRSGQLTWYLPGMDAQSKKLYGRADAVVSVSRKIAEVLERKFGRKIETIYNPALPLKPVESKELNFDYILAIGRMDDNVKQFDKTIKSFADSGVANQGISLVILGDGALRERLQGYAKELQIEASVRFEGHCQNPDAYFKNALFTVQSSRHEGFPNVLVESLAHETPVVSFDCFSGPSEIIIDEKNGLLVKDQDVPALTKAIHRMVTDAAFRESCKQNALESIAHLDEEIIGKQWLRLLSEITTKP